MDPAWRDHLRHLSIPHHPSIDEETIESEYNSALSSGTIIESDDESILDVGYASQLKEKATKVLDRYNERAENTDDDTKELLSAFLDNLPLRGQLVLMTEITCNDYADNPEKLRQLRNFLVDAILKPMKVAGGYSPRVTPSTAPEYDDEVDTSMVEIEPSIRKLKRLRQQCMKRDGHRCVVTGLWDRDFVNQLPMSARKGHVSGDLECSHSLPFALGSFNEDNGLEVRKKTTIWWAMYRYFPGLLSQDVLQAGAINRPENAVTILRELHSYFGRFDFALEPLDDSHKYRCHMFDESSYLAASVPESVTFIQHDTGTGLPVPMPNPDLLRVHSIVAKILNESGLGDLIDATLTDSQTSSFDRIAPDGSTDLGHALSAAMLIRI